MQEKYNKLVKKYGKDIKSLHWPSRERQELSFRAIMNVTSFESKSILDIGCGFGDLYYYLKRNGLEINYEGFDISEEIIKMGKEIYPEIADKLKVFDILKEECKKKFDYVVISGTFNLRISDNWSFIREMVSKCFDICKEGLIFNLISIYVDFQEKHLFYVDPCEIFKFCKTLTKWVNIKYDYNAYEFLIVMFKKIRE